MAASINEIARQYIAEAQRSPHQAPQILRQAAAHFAQMASQPANRHASQKLTTIGLDFAGAAMARQAQAQQAQVQAQEEYQPPTTDDFTQLLRETHQANVELGPDVMSTTHAAMDSMAQRRGNETIDANGVSIQPRTFLNQDTTLGRTTKIKFNPSADEKGQGVKQSETVAFWQGRKQESQAMSIDFGLVLPVARPISDPTAVGPPEPIIDCRPYAIIQYGADGNTQNEVVLDLRAGSRAVIVGNYISVLVGMDPPRGLEFTINGVAPSTPILTVGASIGTFAAVSAAPPTRTIYIDSLGPSGTGALAGLFTVPERAVYLLPPVPASWTDTITVMFLSYTAATAQFPALQPIGFWQHTYSPLTSPEPFLVPADAYYFFVTSAQGVPNSPPAAGGRNGLRIPFQLSL